MNSLHKKINQLEYSIYKHQKSLTQELMLLKEEAKTTKFLTYALMGGFAVGFMLTPKKPNLPKGAGVSKKVSNIISFLTKAYRNIEFILPLILV